MSIGDEPKATPTMQDAARAQPFGYVCARCSRCCRGNRIQLNPYEAARLARRLGIGTREFRMRHTIEARGAELSREADGTCVLLGPYGCTVHADRPLVCRLYPLGRKVSAEGTESFHRLDGHPESDGRFDGHGTVGDYLEAQGAVPYMRAADAYFDWAAGRSGCSGQLRAAHRIPQWTRPCPTWMLPSRRTAGTLNAPNLLTSRSADGCIWRSWTVILPPAPRVDLSRQAQGPDDRRPQAAHGPGNPSHFFSGRRPT